MTFVRHEKIATRGEGDNAARLAALAATDNNPWAFGLTPNNEANQAKSSRDSQYGNLRVLPKEIEGDDGFAQEGDTANMPMDDTENQTASLAQGISATDDPSTDPEDLGASQVQNQVSNGVDTSDLDKRVAMLSGKMGSTNKNHIPSIYPNHTYS